MVAKKGRREEESEMEGLGMETNTNGRAYSQNEHDS